MQLTKEQKSQMEFWGEKRFLSNMWKCRIILTEEHCKLFPNTMLCPGVFNSTEQMYQEMKSLDPDWRKLIRSTEKPTKTKTLSRELIGPGKIYSLRDGWDKIKIPILGLANYLKFSQNPELLQRLQNIQGPIEERNFWGDTFWGTCNGVGENRLGKMLMSIRDDQPDGFLKKLINNKFN